MREASGRATCSGEAYAIPQRERGGNPWLDRTRLASNISLLAVQAEAINTTCSGLLIDTFTKFYLTLNDCCDIMSLAQLAERGHSVGLFLALAGRLTHEGRVSEPAVANLRCER